MSAELAGQAQVKLKWNYQGNYSYYWAIDDISLYQQLPYSCRLSVANDSQFAMMGSSVDYQITIQNTGMNADTYNLSCLGEGSSSYTFLEVFN